MNNEHDVTDIGCHFTRFICKLAKNDAPLLVHAVKYACSAVQNGHVCADLAIGNGNYPALFDEPDDVFSVPDTLKWTDFLKSTSVVGAPGDYRPLILEGSRLYLQKYWHYEKTLSESILNRAKSIKIPDEPEKLASIIRRIFPVDNNTKGSIAISPIVAALKNILVMSGGPGAGKTTLAVKILAMLIEYAGPEKCRIALTAPTGKAAARLKQAIKQACAKIDIPESVKTSLQIEACTIHRLLGVSSDGRFKYNDLNKLPYNIIVMDEASMTDIALFTKFISAVPHDARIILCGDKDQLASIDPGMVFCDICDNGEKHLNTPEFSSVVSSIFPEIHVEADKSVQPLADSISVLKTNFRFNNNSGIGTISNLIKNGDAQKSWKILEKNELKDIVLRNVASLDELPTMLYSLIVKHYSRYYAQTDPVKVFEIFNEFRVLCAIRNGPLGVEGINSVIERILINEGLIRSDSPWYPGRPVMIIANDYNAGLFNGDVGITLRDGSGTKVFFPGLNPDEIRAFSPRQLPPHQTVHAMTVHKSQGSEFGHVLLILPSVFTRGLSRELVYTGITRARSLCELWCNRDIFVKAIENPTIRMSGLREKLWRKHL